ncbi:MAG: RNA polymerase sigma factor [Flavobacteriales bacterium]
MGYSDAELIQGIRNKDDRALKHLYVTHYNMVRHFIISNNGSEDDAKDIYQEGVMVFYDKVHSGNLELSCQIKTFLYAVCRRQWLKKLVQQSRFIGKIEESETLADISDDDVFTIDEKEKDIKKMQVAMGKLGEPCTTIISDFYLHNASMQDICEKMGYTNADNVKNQKYKCLVRLKKIFFINRG